jgi:hypothetical protein
MEVAAVARLMAEQLSENLQARLHDLKNDWTV